MGLEMGFGGLHSVRDVLVFVAYAGALSGLATVGLAAAADVASRGRRPRWMRFAPWLAFLAMLLGLVVVFWRRPFWLGNGGDVGWLSLALAVALALATLAARRAPRPSRGARSALVSAAVGLPLMAYAMRPPVPVEQAWAAAPVASAPVLVFGVDGATWDVLEPVIRSGDAPTLAGLRERGGAAPFRSEIALAQPLADTASVGMRTAVLWETMATGRRPEVHGVWDFLQSRLPGMSRPLPFRIPLRLPFLGDSVRQWLHEEPVGSRSGFAPRLWEVAGRAGLASRIVGWHSTWPALSEPSVCEQISDESHVLGGTGSFATWPRELDGELPPRQPLVTQGLKRRDAQALSDLIFEVTGVRADLAPSSSEDPAVRDNLIRLGLDLARDRFYVETLERRARISPPPPLTTVYIRAVDTVQHLFWQYYEPTAFPEVDPLAVARLGDVIPATYREADRLLARVLAAMPADTTVAVVSDHGAGAWRERAGIFGRGGSAKFATYSGNHRLFGIWIAAGGVVRRGASPRDPSVYDLAPTVAHWLGLPVSSEFTGRVLEETFEPEWAASHPVRRTPTWGLRTIPELGPVGEGADDEYRARLKALGYL
jgi:hypothetical protein